MYNTWWTNYQNQLYIWLQTTIKRIRLDMPILEEDFVARHGDDDEDDGGQQDEDDHAGMTTRREPDEDVVSIIF